MKKLIRIVKCWIFILIMGFLTFSCIQNVVESEHYSGVEGSTNAPVLLNTELSQSELEAGRENRLALVETTQDREEKEIPVQLVENGNKANTQVIFLFPEGKPGNRKFKVILKKTPWPLDMKVVKSSDHQQPVINEGDQKVMQYNYNTVYEKDVVRSDGEPTELKFSVMSGPYFEEYLRSHPALPKDTIVTSSIYSVPRSDYIHPLFGLNGEILTRDWPDGGHPHHRGIFWAWPEVEYNGQRGDIYALQRVFARPTGEIEYLSGPVYAQINATNQWIWEDEVPIVSEKVKIRAYRASEEDRIVDLTLEFLALKENVTIATRFTDSYGGLNFRMQTPGEQEISYFTDKQGSDPLRAWADFNGIFEGNKAKSGLIILQHKSNPEYPGEWVEYPNLSWIQPTFPTPKTRFPLNTTKPLILKYRFVIHSGDKPSEDESKAYWDAYNSENLPELN